MENKWDDIYNFLSTGAYPQESTKIQRQRLRRYSKKFTLKDGDLYFGSRRVIKKKEESRMLFHEFHSTPTGRHFGTRKTCAAICSKFYWYGITSDINKWVQECDQCQRAGKPLTLDQPLQCIKDESAQELELVTPALNDIFEDHWYCPQEESDTDSVLVTAKTSSPRKDLASTSRQRRQKMSIHEKLARELHKKKMQYLKEEHEMKMKILQVELEMKLEQKAAMQQRYAVTDVMNHFDG